jgi:hypothetical protein
MASFQHGKQCVFDQQEAYDRGATGDSTEAEVFRPPA